MAGPPDPAGPRVRVGRPAHDTGFGCFCWPRSVNYGHCGHTPTPAQCIFRITYRDCTHPMARPITTETYRPYPGPACCSRIFPAIRPVRYIAIATFARPQPNGVLGRRLRAHPDREGDLGQRVIREPPVLVEDAAVLG